MKLAQGLTLLAPGVPAFLMGGEWLEDTDFGTDAANKIDWSKQTTYASVYAFFQDAIRTAPRLAGVQGRRGLAGVPPRRDQQRDRLPPHRRVGHARSW